MRPPGVANTLRKLGRWAEAAAEYAALDRIDPACHCGSSAWVNWKCHYPDTLIAAGDAAGARAYMARPDNVDAHEFGSSQLVRARAHARRWRGARRGSRRAGTRTTSSADPSHP